MVIAPVEINVQGEMGDSCIKGVLLEKNDLEKVIGIIDSTNKDGLMGEDAILLMKLKDADKVLS